MSKIDRFYAVASATDARHSSPFFGWDTGHRLCMCPAHPRWCMDSTRLSPSESTVGLYPGQVSWLRFNAFLTLPRRIEWVPCSIPKGMAAKLLKNASRYSGGAASELVSRRNVHRSSSLLSDRLRRLNRTGFPILSQHGSTRIIQRWQYSTLFERAFGKVWGVIVLYLQMFSGELCGSGATLLSAVSISYRIFSGPLK